MTEDTIFIEDEPSDRVLEFTGPDAEERATAWAEHGSETFDSVHRR